MYKINTNEKRIEKMTKQSFAKNKLKEREDLQEWIAHEPSIFGEDLLIIQKEFSGFDDTNERLDLLALDRQGSLVIIENKLDDSGKDVTWQALKYASYCSSFSKENIRKIYQDYLDKTGAGEKAEDRLLKFYDKKEYDEIGLNLGVTQRVILVAAKFRKEVTSTVLWLLNFQVRLQCFKVTPYSMGDELFLTIEKIIPTQDAEEYMIGMAAKAQNEIKLKEINFAREAFWRELLQVINSSDSKTSLFKNISPGTSSWISAGSGVGGASMRFAVAKSYGRAEIYIDRSKKKESKSIYDKLFKNKKEIEKNFCGELIWERLDDGNACRIKTETTGSVIEKETWDGMITFMVDAMVRLEKAFKKPLGNANKQLKAGKAGKAGID